MKFDNQITNVSRRTVLKVAVGAGAVAGLSTLAFGQQGQPIRLGGRVSGWIGQAPARIDGVENPTLRLVAGQTYTLVWENLDGLPHELIIEDATGNELVASETATEQGATVTITFEATTEMAEYYCSYHPTSMRGAVQVNAATETPTPTPTPTATQTPTETPAETPTPTASVVFADQSSAGTTVVVESVTMSEGGFVAIHETVNGSVGPVIGVSQFLEAGTHTDVTATLFELPGAEFTRSELTESQTLIAMPHLDTNGNQVYEFVSSNGTEDGPYVANGSAVVDSAVITVEDGADEEDDGEAARVCEPGSNSEVLGENDADDDGDGAIDEDDEDNDGPSNDDDDGDGAIDEDDECDDGDDGSDEFNSKAEDDDDGDGAFDEDDEPDSGNSDDIDNDGDGAVDEDDESDTQD